MPPFDIGSLFQGIQGVSSILQGGDIAQQGSEMAAASIIQGGEIAAQGAQFTAAGLRQSAESVRQAANFNLQIDAINSKRELSSLARQFHRTAGIQRTQMAASGLNLNSKSYMAIQSNTANAFETALKNMALDAENTRRARIFETQVKQMNLENQARAADYQAQAERVLASNKAAQEQYAGAVASSQAQAKAGQEIGNLIGSIFG
jgi:hypothetical protein